MHEAVVAPKQRSLRYVHIAAGGAFVALAVLGVLLPLVPTTPFVLAASYFFSKSHPAADRWLRNHAVLGPFLHMRERGLTQRAKLLVLLLIIGSFSFSIAAVPSSWLRLGLVLIGTTVALIVLAQPTDRRATTVSRCATAP